MRVVSRSKIKWNPGALERVMQDAAVSYAQKQNGICPACGKPVEPYKGDDPTRIAVHAECLDSLDE